MNQAATDKRGITWHGQHEDAKRSEAWHGQHEDVKPKPHTNLAIAVLQSLCMRTRSRTSRINLATAVLEGP